MTLSSSHRFGRLKIRNDDSLVDVGISQEEKCDLRK